jgi:hypothetical protein
LIDHQRSAKVTMIPKGRRESRRERYVAKPTTLR